MCRQPKSKPYSRSWTSGWSLQPIQRRLFATPSVTSSDESPTFSSNCSPIRPWRCKSRMTCVNNSKRRFGSGGGPMSCISSNQRFSMKWIQPFITSSKCCSMPCPNYGGGSHQHSTVITPTSKFPRLRSAPLDLGSVPTEMAIPLSQRTSLGGQPATSVNSCSSCTSARCKRFAIS